MENYYNTTNESGKQLEAFETKAKTQNEKIMEFLSGQKAIEYGASQLLKIVFNGTIPLTSVRRSITNLVAENRLRYTGDTRMGSFGRQEKLIIVNELLTF